jgi:hypothetical protein
VHLALSSAPAGASRAESTLTGTPSAVESRVANNFTVAATTSGGGSATQSWMVTAQRNGAFELGGYVLGCERAHGCAPRLDAKRRPCGRSGGDSSANQSVTTDQNFGTGPVSGGLASRVFLRREGYAADSDTELHGNESVLILNGESTDLPTAPVAPLVSAVQKPRINGANFFAASTLNTAAVTVSWSAPSGTAPYGYIVQLFVLATPPNGTPT